MGGGAALAGRGGERGRGRARSRGKVASVAGRGPGGAARDGQSVAGAWWDG